MSLADLALPIVKRLNPETAHTLTIKGLKAGIGLPKVNPSQWSTPVKLPMAGLRLPNPVGLAAGFDKNADVFRQMSRFGLGFVECGTVTPRPQAGNAKPRLFRLPEDGAVINRMGFNNLGLLHFTRQLRQSGDCPVPVGANVGANKNTLDMIEDYQIGIREVFPHADYITINISSPNTPRLRGLQDKTSLEELLIRCGDTVTSLDGDKPVFLKVAPDLDEGAIADIIAAVRGAGHWLTGLIISNTTISRPQTLQGRYRNESGGLSGAPLLTLSTAVLKRFAQDLFGDFDLIGSGGISSGADAYAKIRAGAHAVQLYTALSYHGAGLITTINEELAACLKADGFNSVAEAVGADLS